MDDAAATDAAIELGLDRGRAQAELFDGALTAVAIAGPGGARNVLLCRLDAGTATAELHLVPPDAEPVRGFASAVRVCAAALLADHPDLRRVAVTVPVDHGVCAELLAAGLVDEGWAPPPVGAGESRMFTALR